jgi:hypothetical protein
VSEEGGTGPLIPVIVVFVAQADATRTSADECRLNASRRRSIEFPFCGDFNYRCGQTSYQNKPALAAILCNQRRFCHAAISTANVRHVELG